MSSTNSSGENRECSDRMSETELTDRENWDPRHVWLSAEGEKNSEKNIYIWLNDNSRQWKKIIWQYAGSMPFLIIFVIWLWRHIALTFSVSLIFFYRFYIWILIIFPFRTGCTRVTQHHSWRILFMFQSWIHDHYHSFDNVTNMFRCVLSKNNFLVSS